MSRTRASADSARATASSGVAPTASAAPCPVGAAAELAELGAGPAVDPDPVRRPPPPRPPRRPPPDSNVPIGGTRSGRTPRPARDGAQALVVHPLTERRGERESVQVDAERGLAQLRVVPAAEPGGELAPPAGRPVRRGPACRSGPRGRRRPPPLRGPPPRPARRDRRRARTARRARAPRRMQAGRPRPDGSP